MGPDSGGGADGGIGGTPKGALLLLVVSAAVLGAALVAFPVFQSFATQADHSMSVYNADESDHEIHVSVIHDGAEVVNGTWLLGPDRERPVGQFDEKGEYVVRTRTADGATTTESFRLPLAEGGRASFSRIRVTENGTLEIRMWYQQ